MHEFPDCAIRWADWCETIPFWIVDIDPTYSSNIFCFLGNITRILPRVPFPGWGRILQYCVKLLLDHRYYSRNFRSTFGDLLWILHHWALFLWFHHRFFYYFNSFRFREFPSALINVIDNKQINFNFFFKLYLLGHEYHLTLQQSNYILTTLFSNLSNRITKVITFDLGKKFHKLSQGTPSLTIVTPDSLCDTEKWPLYPLSPGDVWLFLSPQNLLANQLPTLTVPHLRNHICNRNSVAYIYT